MGKAGRAPDNYRRRYYVSRHAVEQLRARWESQQGTLHRDDADLGNLVDWAAVSAVDAGRAELVNDARSGGGAGETFTLVDAREELADDVYLVVRPNLGGSPPEAVVTIFTGGMVSQKRASGAWSLGTLSEKLLQLPVAVVGATLKTIEPRPAARGAPGRAEVQVDLGEAGWVRLTLDVPDVLALSKEDRDFLFSLVDAVREHGKAAK